MTMVISKQSDAVITLPDNCMICDHPIQSEDEVGGTESVLGFILPICIHCTEGGAIRQVMGLDQVMDDAA